MDIPSNTAMKCGNCDASLGRLEDAYVWLDQPVCKGCFKHLSATRSVRFRGIWMPLAIGFVVLSIALASLLLLKWPVQAANGSPTQEVQAQARRGLVIEKALNGVEGQQVDVTTQIKSHVQDGTIVGYGDLPGVPGKANTLTITGTYGGEPFVLSFNGADLGNSFRFGRTAPKQ